MFERAPSLCRLDFQLNQRGRLLFGSHMDGGVLCHQLTTTAPEQQTQLIPFIRQEMDRLTVTSSALWKHGRRTTQYCISGPVICPDGTAVLGAVQSLPDPFSYPTFQRVDRPCLKETSDRSSDDVYLWTASDLVICSREDLQRHLHQANHPPDTLMSPHTAYVHMNGLY